MRKCKRILWKLPLFLLLGIALGVIAAHFQWESKTLQLVIIGCCGVYLAATLLHYFPVIHPYRRRVLRQAKKPRSRQAIPVRQDAYAGLQAVATHMEGPSVLPGGLFASWAEKRSSCLDCLLYANNVRHTSERISKNSALLSETVNLFSRPGVMEMSP